MTLKIKNKTLFIILIALSVNAWSQNNSSSNDQMYNSSNNEEEVDDTLNSDFANSVEEGDLEGTQIESFEATENAENESFNESSNNEKPNPQKDDSLMNTSSLKNDQNNQNDQSDQNTGDIDYDIFEQLEALNSSGASFYESYKKFIYNPSGRKSPFQPPKNIRSKQGYKEEEETIRTGLLAYDLESLTLTSLLWDVDDPRALIKDPTGQTHKVKEGVLIGRKDGYIAKIREGEVVVVEKELVRGEDGLEKEIYKTQVLKMGR